MKRLARHSVLLGALLPILAATYGCEDMLEEASRPQGTLNEQTLANANGVEGSLIAAYRALDGNGGINGGWGNAASNWIYASITSDDAYTGTEPTDGVEMRNIELYQWTTTGADGLMNERWRGVYEGVVRANSTLRLLRSVAASPGVLSEADARGIEGEARFLRAHYHFEAYRMWGRIPTYSEDDTDYRKANSDTLEVVAFILKDLDSAAKLLPEAPRKGQIGRAKRMTALAYKGRVHVYAKQWQKALDTLRIVRTAQGSPNGYALEQSYDRVWSGFQDFANGKETIFAYQASSNDGDPEGDNANYGERLNFPHSGSPFGCCGFHQPSQNLVNFFVVDAVSGLPMSLTSPATWNDRDAELDATATIRGGPIWVDPRLDWTVGRDSVPYKDWGRHNVGWIRQPAYSGPYSPKKNVHERTSNSQQTSGGWSPTQQNSVNIHLYRYADLLLMLAEAEVEAGSLENARTLVNEIRARAGVRAQGLGTDRATIAVPLDDPSITWANYRVGQYPAGSAHFASQAAAREAVRTERRLELAMEGQRFFDLRRYNTFVEVLNAYVAKERTRRTYIAAAEPVTAKYRFYPIPQTQIQLSRVNGEDRLKQNPEWGQ